MFFNPFYLPTMKIYRTRRKIYQTLMQTQHLLDPFSFGFGLMGLVDDKSKSPDLSFDEVFTDRPSVRKNDPQLCGSFLYEYLNVMTLSDVWCCYFSFTFLFKIVFTEF